MSDKPGGASDHAASTSEETDKAAADSRAQGTPTETRAESEAGESPADSEIEPSVEEQ